MATRQEALEARGYSIDGAPAPGGLYSPVVVHDNVAYLSGIVPVSDGAVVSKGKVPSQVSVEDAGKAAELCAANLLRVFARDVAPLEQIGRIIKVIGYVNSDPDFSEPQVVVNGASQLLLDVLGEAGKHARAAVGMATLPLGASVEVEMMVALG